MAKIEFRHVDKEYIKNIKAVDNFNISIDDGEFIVFVGPSGCGKSTTLRMVAGLEDISSGEIYIDDELINNISPKQRDIAMVFQNYALYPHMNVYNNMAFALQNKKVDKKEIEKRVNEAAKLLNISELLKRRPKELSGGQRQRVALGRAIVRDAKVFLMDEPLSNLDAKLRVSTRAMIIELHKKLKTNIIYVTHDQTEAMTMGDRIVVMKDGVIQQYDTPVNIYKNPANLFVAGFIGSPQMNFIDVKVKKDADNFNLYLDATKKTGILNTKNDWIYQIKNKNLDKYVDKNLILGIRAENMSICDYENMQFQIRANLIEFSGSDSFIYNRSGEKEIVVRSKGENIIQEGEIVNLNIRDKNINLFDPESEKLIRLD